MDSQNEKINIKIPHPPITSLVFEGGGVKGIAYAGAYKALKERAGFLDKLSWVAGSSAGAMTALLVALNFSSDEIESELSSVNFSKFAQSLPGSKLAIINYIISSASKISNNINHGVNDGKELYNWIQCIVEKKLGTKEASFLDLKEMSDCQRSENREKASQELFNYKNLLVIVTNMEKNKTEIFSWETTPDMQIADAILTSMSIPGFFYVRYIDNEKRKIDWNPTQEKINTHKIIPYVDGGVLNNYPINIFQDYKYWLPGYYGLAKSYNFNPSSLGLRVDSKEDVIDILELRQQEIAKISDKNKQMFPAPGAWISPRKILDMANNFLNLLTSDLNKVEQYCQMTIAIYDCDIKTTQFTLTEEDKDKLKESGRQSVNGFLGEYFNKGSFKKISYNNKSELERDIEKKEQLIEILSNLIHKSTYECEVSRLKLECKVSKKIILEHDGKTNVYSKFFDSSTEVPTSETHQNVSYDSQKTNIMKEFT